MAQQFADGGYSLWIWRLAANTLNNQSHRQSIGVVIQPGGWARG